MSTVIDTLITDRTQADVDRVLELRRKALENGGFPALTSEEKAEFIAGMKGAYNHSDMIRAGNACNFLYQLFTDAGYALSGFTTPVTDYSYEDYLRQADAQNYLNNIRVFHDVAQLDTDVPYSMDYFTFESANAIEETLVLADDFISRLNTSNLYAGELFAGEQ